MTLVADTGAIVAIYDADDKHHRAVRQVVEESRHPLIVPVPVMAEVDYLLSKYLGQKAALDSSTMSSSGPSLSIIWSWATCGDAVS